MTVGFFRRVYEVVARIPPGRVASYGQIAAWLESPRSARTVGWAMWEAPPELSLPCHRVVSRSGALAPAHVFGGAGRQRAMLEAEGVTFRKDGRVDMAKYMLRGAPDLVVVEVPSVTSVWQRQEDPRCPSRKEGDTMGSPGMEKLAAIVSAQPVCTLITLGLGGYPRARTVSRLNGMEEGHLDFATSRSDRKVQEVGANPKVTLFFVDPRTQDHASLYGAAEVLSDAALRRAHWREEFSQHWPGGCDDPNYVILRVRVARGEYLIASTEEIGSVELAAEPASGNG